MVTLSFTIFSGQKNYNRANMLFQVLCGFEPIFYTTHPNEESYFFVLYIHKQVCEKERYSLCKDKVHHVWNYTPIQSD